MYQEFFGFNERPFNVTPDPDFIYYSDQHKEALAHMLYGVQDRKGFILITGRVGSGKTTLCRAFLRELDDSTSTALVLNTTMNSLELLQTIADDFGIELPDNPGSKDIIDRINGFVLKEYREGRNVCVIIDEAQNLAPEVLEHLRLLSNLETNKEKLLQMILVGQPELNNLLNQPQLRQLKQRITVRSYLSNLTEEESREYVLHRMNQANPDQPIQVNSKIFPKLYAASAGNPRAINLICDRLLMAAYIDETFSINCRHLSRALLDLKDSIDTPEDARVLHRLKKIKWPKYHSGVLINWFGKSAGIAAATAVFILTVAWLAGFLSSTSEPQLSAKLSEMQPETDVSEEETSRSQAESEPQPESESEMIANHLDVQPLKERHNDTSYFGIVALGRYISYKQVNPPADLNWPEEESINYELKVDDIIPQKLAGHLVEIGVGMDDPLQYGFPAFLTYSDEDHGKRYLLYLPDEDSFWDPMQGWIEARREVFSRRRDERGFLLVQADFDPTDIYGRGRSGDDIVALQKALNAADDYNIPLEYAHYGAMTEEAVRDFQEKNYLYVDGMAGQQTNLYLLNAAGLGTPSWNREEIESFLNQVRKNNVSD